MHEVIITINDDINDIINLFLDYESQAKQASCQLTSWGKLVT